MHVHVRACVYDITGNSQVLTLWCSHLHEIIMFMTHACACSHLHACMCTCAWGLPPPTHTPINPPPKGHNTQNSEISIHLELIKIIQFCLKNLYLWTYDHPWYPHPPTPPPWSHRSRNLKNSVKREWIEIIEFRLKICDPWALLHIYRLGLMCRWRGVPSQMALLCFEPKKVHVFHHYDSLDKKFNVFALDPTKSCLDWQLSRFLTSQSINNPFKFDWKWRPTWKIWLKSQFAKESSAVEIFEMYPGIMCPLQIINDIEHLSSTLHGVNRTFICHPSNVKINRMAISQKWVNQIKKKVIWVTYFYTCLQILGSNSKYPSLQKFANFFDIWAIGN